MMAFMKPQPLEVPEEAVSFKFTELGESVCQIIQKTILRD